MVKGNALDTLDYAYLCDSNAVLCAVLCGTPDEVIKTAKGYEAADVDLLLCLINLYKISHEKAMQTIELMGRYVLPEFN